MAEEKDGTARDGKMRNGGTLRGGNPDPASHQDGPNPKQIEQAAEAWGIETDYWDIWGKQHRASPELETSILRSLGVNVHSEASLGEAIERRQNRQWRAPLAPTIF